MKINENGVIREATPEEIELFYSEMAAIPYEERVVMRIRTKYSVHDELALLRQRDTKAEEFAEYNAFVEKIKEEEKTKEA